MYEQITQHFKNMTWSTRSVLSTIAIVAIGFVVLALGISFIGAAFRFAFTGSSQASYVSPTSARAPMMAYTEQAAYDVGSYGGGMSDAVSGIASSFGGGMNQLSEMKMRPPSMPVPSVPQTVNGARNSEKYQMEGYSASYETSHFKDTCDKIESLKPLEYVLFDSASQGDSYCSYSFRVEKKKTEEVVGILKALNPKDWSVNVQTVAQNIENTEDQVAVLKRRLDSVEETLTEVERAYKGVTTIAVQEGRVGELTSLVTQKLSMIERLSNEKLSIEEQIHQLTGSKDDQLDQTTYSNFQVSVSKWQAVNWQSIKSQWKSSVQSTLYDISTTLSYIVLTLPALILNMVWYALVLFLSIIALVFFVKYTWVLVKKIWHSA